METASDDDKLLFLRRSASYGAAGADVSVRETHTSWVFLVGDSVYKMKKPIKLPAIDFRTLEAREHNCREELRLNRRLAADVYCDVVPLVRRPNGSMCLGGVGIAIDWLVKMRRLPEDRMLDVLLSQGKLGREQLDALAVVLARFYAAADRPAVQAFDVIQSFQDQHSLNRLILSNSRYDVDHDLIDLVVKKVGDLLDRWKETIARRVADGRYLEGHGDLRPEHICFTEPLVIFDCLEFSRTLRTIDPFDEIAFLDMECSFVGASWVGPHLRQGIARQLNDDISDALYRFYSAFRALMRARMALGHLYFGSSTDAEKWQGKTVRYAKLAADFAEQAIAKC